MEKATISFRIDECLRDAVRGWARDEQRTTSNFMESLLYREKARRDGSTVTLDSLDEKLDRLLASQVKPKPAAKRGGDGTKKLSAYDMEFDDFLSEHYWRKWIDHLHQSEVHINHYQGKMQYERFREIDDDGINCEALIDELIKRTAKSIYVPLEWQRDLVKSR